MPDVTVPQTNRGEKVLDMKSQLVYQGAVWRVQRVGLIKLLALCTDGEESLSSHATCKSLVLCRGDPYGSRWARGHEWTRGGPSGRRVMDPGLSKHQNLPQQRMVAECGLQCVGRELVKV